MIEENLDSIAQRSAIRHINPGTKLFLALGSLIICLISPSPVVPLVSGVVLSLFLIGPGKLSPYWYGKLLLGPATFVGMSIVVLLFMLGGGSVVWQTQIGWLNLSITSGAIRESVLILCRVFGCSISLFFITLTTPMTDLFNGMKKARVPIELVDMMMIMYRFIFIIYDQAVEIWQAQVMRLGYSRAKEAVHSFAMLSGMLFISSWNAGEDLIHAMDCRCYTGVFPALDQTEPVKLPSFLLVVVYLSALCGLLVLTLTTTVFS